MLRSRHRLQRLRRRPRDTSASFAAGASTIAAIAAAAAATASVAAEASATALSSAATLLDAEPAI